MGDSVDDIKFDSDLLATKFLINPEVFNEMSPTIPSGFPINLLPNEKCENEMTQLLDCMFDNKFDNVECQMYQKNYYSCKKWRDSLIFKRIKDWEIELFEFMSSNEKKIYLESMEQKKNGLIDKYEKLPVLPKTRGHRLRIASDIEQIDWRIKYCNNLSNIKNTIRI